MHRPTGQTGTAARQHRWVVERTNSWHNAFKKLACCTERRGVVIGFSLALANAILIVRRLVREAWNGYRGATRPRRGSSGPGPGPPGPGGWPTAPRWRPMRATWPTWWAPNTSAAAPT